MLLIEFDLKDIKLDLLQNILSKLELKLVYLQADHLLVDILLNILDQYMDHSLPLEYKEDVSNYINTNILDNHNNLDYSDLIELSDYIRFLNNSILIKEAYEPIRELLKEKDVVGYYENYDIVITDFKIILKVDVVWE